MQFATLSADYALSAAQGKGQDRYLIKAHFAGVADGATPLDPSWPSNAGEFAAFALSELAQASEQADMDIRTVWRRAISRAAKEFSVVEPQLSCGIAMARQIGDVIEFGTLGDCGAMILLRRGSVIDIRDDRLSELDHEVDAVRGEEAQRRRLRNRASLNTPSGYWAFAAKTEAADHILTKRVNLDDVDKIVLYTDGFYRLRDLYHIFQSDSELLEFIGKLGARGALESLRHYEKSLPGGTPRPLDDATLVVCSSQDSHDKSHAKGRIV
jgi:hypothetical protein